MNQNDSYSASDELSSMMARYNFLQYFVFAEREHHHEVKFDFTSQN